MAGGVQFREWLEELWVVFFFNADAWVYNLYQEIVNFPPLLLHFPHHAFDLDAAVSRELVGIGHQIHQNLLEPVQVSIHHLVHRPLDLHDDLVFTQVCPYLLKLDNLLDCLRQLHFSHIYLELALLDETGIH